jgi:hypothetical protein
MVKKVSNNRELEGIGLLYLAQNANKEMNTFNEALTEYFVNRGIDRDILDDWGLWDFIMESNPDPKKDFKSMVKFLESKQNNKKKKHGNK